MSIRTKKMEHKFNSQEVIDKYSDMIYHIALGYSFNQDDAEDIVQDVLLKYINHFEEFTDEEHAKRWIIRVTINHCCNEMRSARKRKDIPLNEIDKFNDFESTCENNLFDCIRKLDETYRSVFELHYFQDFKIYEICRILNIREATVKTRLKRARDKIKESLKKGDRFI